MTEHAEWCHIVTGCIEPSHCTCDYAAPGCEHIENVEIRTGSPSGGPGPLEGT